jgi:hypothetical protein
LGETVVAVWNGARIAEPGAGMRGATAAGEGARMARSVDVE